MLDYYKKLIYFMIIAVVLWGCSTKAVIDTNNEKAAPAQKSSHFFQQEPSDKDIFEETLLYLSNRDKEPDYNEARMRLENLVQQFPNSKWAPSAQALILSLDKISTLQTKLKQEKQKAHAENLKLTREIDDLRDSNKQLADKYSVDILKLQQENEQLKNDIQQLKTLEIQLEKREKMLR